MTLEGQKCGKSYRDDGICKKVTNCPSAVEALSKRKPHNMNRCGFDGTIEIVCCPTSDVREFRDRDEEKPNLWTAGDDVVTNSSREGLSNKRKSEIGM